MRFGEYLGRLRESRNISKTDMAKKIDVSLGYYSQLESGAKKPPTFEKVAGIVDALNLTKQEEHFLIKLAVEERTSEGNTKFLKEIIHFQENRSMMQEIDPDKDFTGQEVTAFVNPYIPVQEIPILNWVHASGFVTSTDADFPVGYGVEGKMPTDLNGRHLFALRVKHHCMEPEFRDGDIIVIDPDQSVKSGDYVVVKLLDREEATFKQIKIYDSKVVLHPLNPSFPDIEYEKNAFDKQVRVIGRVVEKKKRY